MNNRCTEWKVLRHGGMTRGAGSRWREVANGDEATCREVFDNQRRFLRQGTVELYNPAGEVCQRVTAPRLRSRW
jgi:hypothetical protein